MQVSRNLIQQPRISNDQGTLTVKATSNSLYLKKVQFWLQTVLIIIYQSNATSRRKKETITKNNKWLNTIKLSSTN